MMSKEKLVMGLAENLINGGEIYIHKTADTVCKNCLYIETVEDIPPFLLEDHAVEINSDGRVILNEPGSRAIRPFPFFLCWNVVPEENISRVPGIFGCWSKDDGFQTLSVLDGRCYYKPNNVHATLVTDELPVWVAKSRFPVHRDGDYYVLNRTDCDEKWSGKIFRSLWLDYGNDDLDIVSVHAHFVNEYIVTQDGEDLCKLTNLLRLAGLIESA